jgi:catechol 2,3-dioxygenase-like lactoylglutathione lyase family enzyme
MIKLAKQELDVGIVPSDAEATTAFYRDVIGLEALPSMQLGGGAEQRRFRIGKHMLKLNCLAKPPARQQGGIEHAVGIRLLALIVDELSPLLARLDAAGCKHTTLPVPESAGFSVAFVKDPEGNVLELVGLKKPAGKELSARLQIGLTVSNLERSRHFYGELLGLPEQPPMHIKGGTVETRYGFTWGATTVKMWKLPGELPVQTGNPNGHAGARYFTAMVEDLDAAHAELKSKDIPIVAPPFELPGVARLMFFADPDGNWIELAQRVQR